MRTLKEKPSTLHWDNRNRDPKGKPLPPKAPSGGDVDSFERREAKLRIQLKRWPASGGQAVSLAGP